MNGIDYNNPGNVKRTSRTTTVRKSSSLPRRSNVRRRKIRSIGPQRVLSTSRTFDKNAERGGCSTDEAQLPRAQVRPQEGDPRRRQRPQRPRTNDDRLSLLSQQHDGEKAQLPKVKIRSHERHQPHRRLQSRPEAL